MKTLTLLTNDAVPHDYQFDSTDFASADKFNEFATFVKEIIQEIHKHNVQITHVGIVEYEEV